MDVFEKLNRTFGVWYEGLFGGSSDDDLRPRAILRRILAAMEDGRREGLDGQVYVPNHYTLDIVVADEDERQYLRTFLQADELAAAMRRHAQQHGYKLRGGLHFQINEVDAPAADEGADRVQVRCRFDTTLPDRPAVVAPEDIDGERRSAPVVSPRDLSDYAAEEEPGTVPAVALASLTIRGASGPAEVFPLTARGAQIGRSRQAGNDIVLAGDGMVSKRHARIALDPSGWTVYDLQSTNGTFVNDLSVEGSHALQSGDQIRVGETELAFRANTPRSSAPPAARAVARLVSEGGESFPLASQMAVGRALTGDIVLVGDGVAAKHALVTVRGDQVYVEDLNSSGGTFVNQERIPPHFPVALYAGDVVAFGSVTLRLERFEGARPV